MLAITYIVVNKGQQVSANSAEWQTLTGDSKLVDSQPSILRITEFSLKTEENAH